jgi:hypothetical protein
MFTRVNIILADLVHQFPLQSVEQVTTLISPYASGINNGGLIIPTPNTLKGNQGCKAWCHMMSMYNVNHMNYWLREFSQQQSLDLSIALAILPSHQCFEHVLPCLFFSEVPFQIKCRTVHITELIAEYNMEKVEDLLHYIWSVIGLGLFANDFIATKVYEIDDIDRFIASRLFQGEVDSTLSLGGRYSYFVSKFQESSKTYDSFEFMYNVESNPDNLGMLVQREKQLIASCTFLGNETPQVIAIEEALKLPLDYKLYLRSPNAMEKVGPQVFYEIIHGTLLSAPQRGYADDEVEFKNPVLLAPKTSNPDVTNTSAKFLPLFGGSGTAICDFGGSNGVLSNTLNNFHANDIRLI